MRHVPFEMVGSQNRPRPAEMKIVKKNMTIAGEDING